MSDIIIYTTIEVLEHKKKDGLGKDYCYWSLSKPPKKLEKNKKTWGRIYFATKGFIRGYFEIFDIRGDGISAGVPDYFTTNKDGSELDTSKIDVCFKSETWHEFILPIPTKSFQGFKYADKVPELKSAEKVTKAKVK